MKSEPDVYGIDDLAKAEATDRGMGCGNYQARNIMRDEMQIGDRVLFYHSNAKPPGVIGEAEVSTERATRTIPHLTAPIKILRRQK